MLKNRRNPVSAPPGCALNACLDYLRGAWTANVLWYLREQPRRFSELKRDLEGISSKVLAQRLRRMERDGLVLRFRVPTSPPSTEYAQSGLARELLPALEMLVAVGTKIKLKVRSADLGDDKEPTKRK